MVGGGGLNCHVTLGYTNKNGSSKRSQFGKDMLDWICLFPNFSLFFWTFMKFRLFFFFLQFPFPTFFYFLLNPRQNSQSKHFHETVFVFLKSRNLGFKATFFFFFFLTSSIFFSLSFFFSQCEIVFKSHLTNHSFSTTFLPSFQVFFLLKNFKHFINGHFFYTKIT